MALYAIHDESGKIKQANKIFAPTAAYEQQLRDLGQSFAVDPTAMLLSPDDWYVDVAGGALTERPTLPVVAVRTKIKAGGGDRGVLIGVPKAGKVTITTGGMVLFQDTPGATELEIPIPVPCVYRVAIALWPYRTYVAEIEAFA